MDDREIPPGGWRDFDARRRFRERSCWKKRERQVRDGFPKVRPRCPVPRVNRIEAFEQRTLCCGDADKIEAGISDGAGAVGKTD
jgi:hypothetical protein